MAFQGSTLSLFSRASIFVENAIWLSVCSYIAVIIVRCVFFFVSKKKFRAVSLKADFFSLPERLGLGFILGESYILKDLGPCRWG